MSECAGFNVPLNTLKDGERAPVKSVCWFCYRVTACNATHGIVIAILSVRLSVRLSVCPSDACIVTKLNKALRIF